MRDLMMKMKRLFTIGTVAGFGFAAALSAQQQPAPDQHQQLQKLGELKGAQVKSLQGEELGQLEDLAVNLENGEAAFAIVSSGGFLGIGGDWHPVPAEALQVSGGGEEPELQLNIDKEQWEQAPTIEREEIAELDQQGEQIYEYYAQDWQAHEQQHHQTEVGGSIQLASDLDGATVHGQNQEEIGRINDLLVDLQQAQLSFVLLQPQESEDAYAVAPRSLEMESEQEFRLNVTRREFEQVETASQQELRTRAQHQQEMQVSEARESSEIFRYQEAGQQQYGATRRDVQKEQKQEVRDPLQKAREAQEEALDAQEEAEEALKEVQQNRE